MRGSRGAAILEFALAWPLVLLVALGAVQLAVWSAEVESAHFAAAAGARVGSAVGADQATATQVALAALRPSLVGARAVAWCPGQGSPPGPGVLGVCTTRSSLGTTVTIAGSVPALVPLVPGAYGLPVWGHTALPLEAFG